MQMICTWFAESCFAVSHFAVSFFAVSDFAVHLKESCWCKIRCEQNVGLSGLITLITVINLIMFSTNFARYQPWSWWSIECVYAKKNYNRLTALIENSLIKNRHNVHEKCSDSKTIKKKEKKIVLNFAIVSLNVRMENVNKEDHISLIWQHWSWKSGLFRLVTHQKSKDADESFDFLRLYV